MASTFYFKEGKLAFCGFQQINYLKEVFKLSEGEASFLVTCLIGEGLLKVGSDTAILQITQTKKEFEFVETNLNKLAQRNEG